MYPGGYYEVSVGTIKFDFAALLSEYVDHIGFLLIIVFVHSLHLKLEKFAGV
jgi:hypothetical protein